METPLDETRPMPAPDPAPPNPSQPTPAGSIANLLRRPPDYWLLWVVVIISLGFNVYLLDILLGIEEDIQAVQLEVAEGALNVAAGVWELRNAAFTYNVIIDESIPVDIVVPIRMDVPVVVDEEIAVSTTIFTRLPPLNIPYNFPISTTFPVNIETNVPINEDVVIDDAIPVSFEVPIRITVADTPFAQSIDDAYYGLLEFARQLGAPDADLAVMPGTPLPPITPTPEP